MTMISAPYARRRLVGGALRRYREHLGWTLEEPARLLECDKSKVSRIETGQRGIRARDLRDLLAEYGVGHPEAGILAAIANPRIPDRWWQHYTDLLPAEHQDYLIMETLADELLIYDAQQIPDLLQTPDYARAVAEADPRSTRSEAVDRAVEMIMARQQAITSDHRSELHVIIGEAALRQIVGGTKVMRAQLRCLGRISVACPQISLRVLPFTSGALPSGGSSPMTIIRYADAPSLGVAYLPGLTGVCLVDQSDVAGFVRAFTQLQISALPPAESVRLLWELLH
jgi:transcriptional regulator with XRE-family HTH domain